MGAQIPLELAKGHARVSSEGHRGLHEILVSLQADLLEVKAKFEAHIHVDSAAGDTLTPKAPNTTIAVGTTVQTAPTGPFNLPGTNGV